MPAQKEKRFEGLSFLEALHHAKNDRKIMRKGWADNLIINQHTNWFIFEKSLKETILQDYKPNFKDFEAQDWIAFN